PSRARAGRRSRTPQPATRWPDRAPGCNRRWNQAHAVMDARNCLLYDPHASSGQILALINDAGWRVTRIDAAQPAYLHETEDGRGVGLAVIGARAGRWLVPVQRLIAQSPCRPWVALLEPEVTLTQDLLHLLGTYFEDYQVLPVS